MWKCLVHVTDSNGNPRSGVRVALFGSGFLGGTLEAYTAGDGWAEIVNTARERPDWIVESIYVDGKEVSGSARIMNGQRMSVTL